MTFKRRLALKAFELADLSILLGALGLAAWTEVFGRAEVTFSQVLAIRLRLVNVFLLLGMLLLWRIVLRRFGLYQSHRLSSLQAELGDLLKATLVCTLIVLSSAIFFHLQIITARFVLVFWIASSAGTLILRVLLRSFLRKARLSGRNLSRVLIVGTNSRALEFANRLRARRELGYEIAGFVDDHWAGIDKISQLGEKVVCGLDELPRFLRAHVIDEVIIALPISSAYARSAEIARLCEKQGIIVRYIPDFFNLSIARIEVTEFDGKPLVSLHTGAMWGAGVLLKRTFDLLASSVMLVVMSPVLILTSLLIKLTSRGPIFFIQERIGLNKRRFPLIKFRTMVFDAEKRLSEIEHLNEVSGPVFKIRNDPRLTPLGKILRTTSLDEIPQLFNVMLGHMSLVGPRPLPVRDYDGFDEDWHRRRFSVRPGITCLWQVSGRSSIPFERWMELDMKYIDEWSLLLDFRILARTIPAVLRGQGAA